MERAPHQGALWRLWGSLVLVAGDGGRVAFLDGLHPIPGFGELPPNSMVDPVVAAYRTQGLWDRLRNFLELERRRGWGATMEKAPTEAFPGTWTTRIARLVEAHLRLRSDDQAEVVVCQALANYGPRDLPTAAAKVALACGRAELAQRWAGLRVER